MGGWENFFFAQVGASAALTGLVFVGVSINLAKIMGFPGVPERALQALISLTAVLVIASLQLVPGQPRGVIGAEVLAVALPEAVGLAILSRRRGRVLEKQRQLPYTIRIALLLASVVPFVIAGGSLIAGVGGGLYWLVPGVVFSYASAIVDAWVLLIEINR